jgi:serine/threonine protein kinase
MNEPEPSATPTHRPTLVGGGRGTAAAPGTLPRYGRFAVQRFHAKGGLGEVHVAVDEELKRDVALKRMQERCANDPAARRRFLNEAEITAKLEHPGIVPIYGLVQDEHGQPCYAMRFIEGESLGDAIKRFHGAVVQASSLAQPQARTLVATAKADFTSLEFRQLLQRFISVCNTIAYAHSKQVIHRDIKPANVMLGPFGETLVVDWGLARELAVSGQTPAVGAEEAALPSTMNFAPSGTDELVYTQAGQALGTLGYMAPEQAAGRWNVVGPCSDIFSLGATLYELLTGQRPIRGQDQLEAMQNAQAGKFARPRGVKPQIPKALEAVCLKAMAFELNERYATAKDLAADLEHWLADEPVAAWREPWTVRARRWLRRHRTVVIASLATLLVGVAALVAGVILITKHAAELDATNTDLTQAKHGLETSNADLQVANRNFKSEADKYKALADFLVAVFRKEDPAQETKSLKVIDLLATAAAKLDKEYAGDAATKARLLDALGRTQFNLGEYNNAVGLHEQALAVRRGLADNDSEDLLWGRAMW